MTPGFFPFPGGLLPTPAQAFRYWCGAPCVWTRCDDAWVLAHSRPDLTPASLQQATALRLLAAAQSLQPGLELLRAPAAEAAAMLAADALISDVLLPPAAQGALLTALIALRQALAERLARELASPVPLSSGEWSLRLGAAFADISPALTDAIMAAMQQMPAAGEVTAGFHYTSPSVPTASWPGLADAGDFAARAGRRAARLGQCPFPSPPAAGTRLADGPGWQLHHHPAASGSPGRPLLLVPALVNGSQLLHLGAGQSLVEALVAEGVSVYQLEWTGAAAALPTLTAVLAALRQVITTVRTHAAARPALFGICQGGWLAMWAAAADPASVARLFLAAVPGGRHASDRLARWLDAASQFTAAQLSAGQLSVGQLVPGQLVTASSGVDPAGVSPSGAVGFGMEASGMGASGTGPGDPSGRMLSPPVLGAGPLNIGFLRLQPFQQRVGKYLQLAASAAEPDWPAFLRLEHWLFASPPLAAPALADFAARIYAPASPDMNVPDSESSLTSLKPPLHWLLATRDHLAPPAATRALAARLPATISVDEFDAGHVGLFAGRARLQVAARVAALLKAE